MKNEILWKIDHSHSEISFKVIHLMIAYVKGSFKTFDASIRTQGKDFKTAEIDLWIDASSIGTGDAKRDYHLQGPDFLDAKNHRLITFRSDYVGKSDLNGNYELLGRLTIKGISRQVRFNAKFGGMNIDPWGNEKAGFTVTGKIMRSDWGLTWNTPLEKGGLLLSDEVIISCEIELLNVTPKELMREMEAVGENPEVIKPVD